jgi:hypothetical protein
MEERPLGRPPKTSLTRMNAPYYPSYIVATVSKQNLCWCCVMCYRMNQHCETRYNCENCRMTLCAASWFQHYHMVGWKANKVQQVAKKCMNIRFLWLESVLRAGIENCAIIIVACRSIARKWPIHTQQRNISCLRWCHATIEKMLQAVFSMDPLWGYMTRLSSVSKSSAVEYSGLKWVG